jgi:hypothetical protein
MSGGSSCEQAFCVIQNGQLYICIYIVVPGLIDLLLVLPLFNPTKIFLHNLERFQASLLMATSFEHLSVKDTFSSQRPQSNSAAVTKSSNVHDRNESKHTSPANNGHEVDSAGAFGDFINLKIATRQASSFI